MSLRISQLIIIICSLGLLACCIDTSLFAQSYLNNAEGLKKLADLEVPDAKTIFTGTPKDWMVLKDGNVIVCDPVTPRPDTLKKIELREQEILKQISALKRTVKDSPEIDALQAEKDALKLLNVSVEIVGKEDQLEYQIELRYIDYFIYFEDLILKRVDLEIQATNFNLAYELLVFLTRRMEQVTPNIPASEELWPGIKQREYDLLFFSAKNSISKGDIESGLMALEDLFKRNPDYPQLEKNMSQASESIIKSSVADNDFRQARFFLNRLANYYPQQEVVTNYRNQFSSTSKQAFEQAKKLWEDNQRSEAIELYRHAANIWPATEGLLGEYRKNFKLHQVLRMGVIDRPIDADFNSMFNRPVYFQDARYRHIQLCSIPLFDLVHVNDGRPHFDARIFDEWLPTDLGRTFVLTTRKTPAPFDLINNITSQRISENLLVRLDPASPLYDERLDYFIDELSVPSPDQIKIKFRYIPLQGESLLSKIRLLDENKPVPENADSPPANNTDSIPASATPQIKYASRWNIKKSATDDYSFFRPQTQPAGLEEYNIAEIQERVYPDYFKLIQALNRGEIDCISRIDPKLIPELKKNPRYFVEPYAYPTVHLLQFHPDSPLFAVKEYRKAVSMAIDRAGILNTVIPAPENNSASIGKVITAAYPSKSDIYNKTLPQILYEPSASLVLGFAARKKFNGKLPPLRLLAPREIYCQPIIEGLKHHLERVQLPVEVVFEDTLKPAEKDPGWDIVYRQTQMHDPRIEIWPFLTLSSQSDLSTLQRYPEWFRQRILELDNSTNWSQSEQIAQQLQKDILGEVLIIPLFEIQEHFIYRKQVRNVPTAPSHPIIHPYDNVERWNLEPYLPPN